MAELEANGNEGAEAVALGKEKLGAEAAEEVTKLELELRNENPGAEVEAGGGVIELDSGLGDDAAAKLEKEGAADEEDEPNKLGKDGAAADEDGVTDGEAPNVVEEKLGVDVPKEDDDPNKPEEKGELTAGVAVELEAVAEEAPNTLPVPKVEVEPNKLVVVVIVPLELELDPNKPDPPNGDAPAGDDVPNNEEPVAAAEGAPKPKVGVGADGAAEDGVEDAEDANANPNEGVDDGADDEDAPNEGAEDVDEPNIDGDEAGFENENGDGDEDDANENGDGDDDDDDVERLVEKEKPDIVDASLSLTLS